MQCIVYEYTAWMKDKKEAGANELSVHLNMMLVLLIAAYSLSTSKINFPISITESNVSCMYMLQLNINMIPIQSKMILLSYFASKTLSRSLFLLLYCMFISCNITHCVFNEQKKKCVPLFFFLLLLCYCCSPIQSMSMISVCSACLEMNL